MTIINILNYEGVYVCLGVRIHLHLHLHPDTPIYTENLNLHLLVDTHFIGVFRVQNFFLKLGVLL